MLAISAVVLQCVAGLNHLESLRALKVTEVTRAVENVSCATRTF